MRKTGQAFVKSQALHLAKREMQQMLSSRVTWVCLLAVGLVLGMAGPFETSRFLGPLPLTAYWMGITVVFFWVGAMVTTVVAQGLGATRLPELAVHLLGGAVAGAVLFCLLIAVNVVVFGISLDCPSCLLGLAANVIVISTIVTGAIYQVKRHLVQNPPEVPEAAPTQDIAILKRLPLEKRGALLSISVSDHYVEVVTDKGSALLLMRLVDAMAETAGTQGMQVHRSHWVALNHIASARRDGAKAVLTLTDGRDIPASRTYVPALKEAGILPG